MGRAKPLPPPEEFLPLHRDTFQILVALADRDRHGYSILRDIAERSGGAHPISPSTLYSSIRRLLESGLIEELDERPDPEDDDERRRYYRLTALGRAWPYSKRSACSGCLSDARAGGLLPRPDLTPWRNASEPPGISSVAAALSGPVPPGLRARNPADLPQRVAAGDKPRRRAWPTSRRPPRGSL